MATKTIDDIQPKAVMSPNEQGRWFAASTSNSCLGACRTRSGLAASKFGEKDWHRKPCNRVQRYSFPLLSKLL